MHIEPNFGRESDVTSRLSCTVEKNIQEEKNKLCELCYFESESHVLFVQTDHLS